MTTLTYIHHSNFKINKHRVYARCFLFLLTILLTLSTHAKDKNKDKDQVLKVAIFDTSFCPNLLPKKDHIDIEPVQDFSQSNDYTCNKDLIKNYRFHGQWVLESILLAINPQNKIRIYPFIVFNKAGDQKQSYWELALKKLESESIQVSLMAVGLPVTQKNLKKLSQLFNKNQSYILMAAGQQDARLRKAGLTLFPQHAKNDLLALMIGEYYPALAVSENALLPPNQLFDKEIDYFMVKKEKNLSRLKDSSLSLAEAFSFAVNHCEESLPSFLKLSECLSAKAKVIKAQTNLDKVIDIKAFSY